MMNKKLFLILALLFSFNGWAYSETDQEELRAIMEAEDLEYAQALRQQQMELDQMIDEDDTELMEDKQSKKVLGIGEIISLISMVAFFGWLIYKKIFPYREPETKPRKTYPY